LLSSQNRKNAEENVYCLFLAENVAIFGENAPVSADPASRNPMALLSEFSW
jgi:hypothetical protein